MKLCLEVEHVCVLHNEEAEEGEDAVADEGLHLGVCAANVCVRTQRKQTRAHNVYAIHTTYTHHTHTHTTYAPHTHHIHTTYTPHTHHIHHIQTSKPVQ